MSCQQIFQVKILVLLSHEKVQSKSPPAVDHRITEPQNQRMAGFGRDLWRSNSPYHLLMQVHLE